MGIFIHGEEIDGPQNLVIKNFGDPAVPRFKNQARPGTVVTEVVVHETVTRSWKDTVSVLKSRGLGVHFIVDSDGTVYQHADLLEDEMWHASQHNPMSVGIETVNPYEPQLAPAGGPWIDSIANAPWAAGGEYLLPTAVQAEAVCQLLDWLTSSASNPLTIPQQWPGLSDAHKLALGRVGQCATPSTPGVLAHMYFGHADGAWLVLYAWLRLEAKLDPVTALAEARRRATGVVAADLGDYFAANPYLVA